jgi:hypothetical protein
MQGERHCCASAVTLEGSLPTAKHSLVKLPFVLKVDAPLLLDCQMHGTLTAHLKGHVPGYFRAGVRTKYPPSK